MTGRQQIEGKERSIGEIPSQLAIRNVYKRMQFDSKYYVGAR